MSHNLIRQAFEARLAAWAAGKTPPLQVAWENTTFIQPITTYLQAFVLPARTTSDTLDGIHRHYRGVFQVTICIPLNQGPAEAEGLAIELDALFPLTAPMVVGGVKVMLLSPMSAAPGFPDQELWSLPVSAIYRGDTVN